MSVGEVGAWEWLGKVCVDLNSLPFLFPPYLCYGVKGSVGVHSVSGLNSFSLVFPPPTLGLPPICLQSAVCCKGEAGNSLGRNAVAAGSYCSSKQKAKLE